MRLALKEIIGIQVSKRKKGQSTIYKTLHIKLQIEQHEPTKSRG